MIFFFWVGFSVVVGVLASSRGRSGFGWFLLSCLISPLLAGLLVAVLPSAKADAELPSDKTHVRCTACAEFVLPMATKCKHCGADLVPNPGFGQSTEKLWWKD